MGAFWPSCSEEPLFSLAIIISIKFRESFPYSERLNIRTLITSLTKRPSISSNLCLKEVNKILRKFSLRQIHLLAICWGKCSLSTQTKDSQSKSVSNTLISKTFMFPRTSQFVRSPLIGLLMILSPKEICSESSFTKNLLKIKFILILYEKRFFYCFFC